MRISLQGQIPDGEYGFLRHDGSKWNVTYNDEKINCDMDESAFAVLNRSEYRLLGLPNGDARVIRFADLHRHSDNSLQDGMTKVSDMVKRTEYSGALTDHGNMYGFLEYYKKMREAGKQPILGFEGYMVDMHDKLEGRHVILLAKDFQGYKNLLKLTSESFDHFHYKPHITWEMLAQYHEGIICLSACLAGVIPSALSDGNESEARAAIERFMQIFGKDDFYIEIQRHHIALEDKIRPKLVALAKEYELKIVATTDSHYPTPEDREAHDILLCLQTGKTISDPNRMKYDGDGYFLFDSEQMEELFAEYPEALDNTLEISEKCHVEIPLGEVNLPNYEIPAEFESPHDYMLHIAKEGFADRFRGTPHFEERSYWDRFNYEAEMIKNMGFASYFIIVWDFINFAKTNDIYIGPGRGSAAGSMIAYCMGITDLDPIAYDLLFERFLNPERISWPDIDTDIEYSGRAKVIQYMIQKYHAPNVCRIITFGTFAAKQSIKDVARVLEYPVSFRNKISDMIPSAVGMTIERALEESPEFARSYRENDDVRRVVDIAKKIEGGKRHASQHACGLCVAPKAVSEFLPTSMEIDEETGEKALTSQVVMTEVEELGLIKMDLLGLRNLGVIHEVLNSIQTNYGKEAILEQIGSERDVVRYQDIPLDDRATYKMLRDGFTGGVFQLESPGMTKVVVQMLEDVDTLPDERVGELFERLIAAVALYRPGPMDYIPDYISSMKDPSSIHYDCPEEESILASTFGVMVYQEQLMQIAQKLARYSLGDADILRKACGKKKKDLMAKEHVRFVSGNHEEFESGKATHLIPGCINNGISEKVAEGIWDKMTKFGSYAFNRSHAACYAYIAYLTAYMSCHWPNEFYAAMINAFINNSDKTKSYLSQASDRGIPLLVPDIQKSICLFAYHPEDKAILFGLQGISGLKAAAVDIVAERDKNGPFKDLQDLYFRMGDRGTKLQKKAVERLIYAGALNCFSDNKAALLQQLEKVDLEYNDVAAERLAGQYSFFGEEDLKIPLPDVKPFSKAMELEKELETLGMYVSSHPTDLYTDKFLTHPTIKRLEDVVNMDAGRAIKTLGLVKDYKEFYTKKNHEKMCAFTLEVKYASINCVMYPKYYANAKDVIGNNAILCVSGDLISDNRDEAKTQISVKSVEFPDYMIERDQCVIINVSNKQEQENAITYVKENPGSTPVYLKAHGKTFRLKSSIDDNEVTREYLAKHFRHD